MPRYVVQRSFRDGLQIPIDSAGGELCRPVIERNAREGVTWVTSFVSEDRARTFCVYDAPAPQAIRGGAALSLLAVEEITRVSVLDPYFYK